MFYYKITLFDESTLPIGERYISYWTGNAAVFSKLRIGWFLKAVRVKDFHRCLAIQSRARAQRAVQPVMRIDEVDVVAGTQDPSVTELPSQDAADGIVLKIVGDGNPGTELLISAEPQDRR